MQIMYKILLFLIFLYPQVAFATGTDFMRNTGKIYVVILVVVILFLGIAYYMYTLDCKLTKLENRIKNE